MPEAARREADFVHDNNIKVLVAGSEGYPVRLAECDDAPAMLLCWEIAMHFPSMLYLL